MKNNGFMSRLLPLQLDYLFLILGFIFGLLFVFINPPYQTNDEDRHFYAAYSISNRQFLPENNATMSGTPLPRNLVIVSQNYQGIPFYQGTKISKARMEESLQTKLNPTDTVFYSNPMLVNNPIPYLPAAIGIMAGKIINSNPVWLNRWGRLGCLLGFLILIFYAIKITPVFKSVFFLYGLTPMVLYQGASVTYDSISIALTFLMVAYFLYLTFAKYKVEMKDIIIIAVIAFFQRFAKDGYVLLPFLLYLIPLKKFGDLKKAIFIYAGFFVYFIILYYLPGWTWTKIVAAQHLLPGVGGIKDFVYSPHDNLIRTLASPFEAFGNIFISFLFQRQEWIGGTIGRFGYAYALLPKFFLIIHGLVLLTVALLDNNKDYNFRFWQKLLIFAAGFGTVAAIIIGFYFNGPVGCVNIFGLQGRYFIQAVPVVLLLLYNNKFDTPQWTKYKGICLGVYVIISLTYVLFYLDNYFYNA